MKKKVIISPKSTDTQPKVSGVISPNNSKSNLSKPPVVQPSIFQNNNNTKIVNLNEQDQLTRQNRHEENKELIRNFNNLSLGKQTQISPLIAYSIKPCIPPAPKQPPVISQPTSTNNLPTPPKKDQIIVSPSNPYPQAVVTNIRASSLNNRINTNKLNPTPPQISGKLIEEQKKGYEKITNTIMSSNNDEKFLKQAEQLDIKLKAPQSGDWLSSHQQEGQTFAQYQSQKHIEVTSQRNILYFLPLDGRMNQVFLDQLKQFCLAWFYPLDVKIMDVLPIDELKTQSRWNSGRKQYRTNGILQNIPQYLPADAYSMIAITTFDLYPNDNWNFVFGWATYTAGVAVFSFCRFHPSQEGIENLSDQEAELIVLYRASKILCHQTGHMFNLRHCTENKCLMGGMNGLWELDSHPYHYCGVCLRQFHYTLQFNVQHRLKLLKNICLELQGNFLKQPLNYIQNMGID